MNAKAIINDIRQKRRFLHEENKQYSEIPTMMPKETWRPAPGDEQLRIAVYRSKNFLVQIFNEPENRVLRMSVNRTQIDAEGRWKDGITWDELMFLKQSCGYGDFLAVEIYPPSDEIVDVANMRHIWILPPKDTRINFGWRKNKI